MCMWLCILNAEGSKVFANRALIVVCIDGRVSDWFL